MRTCALLLTAIATAASTKASADFQLEMSGKEIRETMGARVIEDLIVGETGNVKAINTCSRDGRLFLYTMTSVAEDRTSYAVTLEPDRRISIEITSEAGGAPLVQKMMIAAVAGAHHRLCSVAGMAESELMRVSTINGLVSDTQVFEAK